MTDNKLIDHVRLTSLMESAQNVMAKAAVTKDPAMAAAGVLAAGVLELVDMVAVLDVRLKALEDERVHEDARGNRR